MMGSIWLLLLRVARPPFIDIEQDIAEGDFDSFILERSGSFTLHYLFCVRVKRRSCLFSAERQGKRYTKDLMKYSFCFYVLECPFKVKGGLIKN